MTKLLLTKNEIVSSYYDEKSEQKSTVQYGALEEKKHLTAATKFLIDKSQEYFEAIKDENLNSKFSEESIEEIINELDQSYDIGLEEKEKKLALEELRKLLFNYDVLEPLLRNPEINDVIISSFDNISVQKGRSNIRTDFKFKNQKTYEAFIERLLKKVGKSCTLSTPVVDAAIEPHIRACVTHSSFSPEGTGPMLTLRISRHSNVNIEQLKTYELAPSIIIEYLAHVVSTCAETVLIAGEVGTGKTTLVKALAAEISNDEAILVIEDTHEIKLERDFIRTLLTREANTEGAGKIEPAQAIRTGMRMAMNRIILGEMRDAAAAEAFIDVCSSGHPGMSTIHARSAKDAISRLELLLSRAQQNVNIDTIRKEISNAISVIVFLSVDKKNKKRRIAEVLEVHHSSDGAVQLAPIFRYENNGSPFWLMESGISKYKNSLDKIGVNLPRPGTRISISAEQIYRSILDQGSNVH